LSWEQHYKQECGLHTTCTFVAVRAVLMSLVESMPSLVSFLRLCQVSTLVLVCDQTRACEAAGAVFVGYREAEVIYQGAGVAGEQQICC
jgi:hypothetical protein